jgi:hypothetical protein
MAQGAAVLYVGLIVSSHLAFNEFDAGNGERVAGARAAPCETLPRVVASLTLEGADNHLAPAGV